MKLIYKIVEAIKESEHEVVLPLYDILDGEINQNDAFYIKKLNRWLDELQEMYDKAEVVEDVENSLNQADNLLDVAESELRTVWETLSEARGHTNV